MSDTMHNTLSKYVESGFVPGLVAGVWRDGELTIDAIGAQSFGGGPMRPNSIFRLASITKPVVAAAAMILVDDGKLQLDEPVDRLLPELADRKVLTAIDAPLDSVVPAVRAITLRQLLNMTFGLGAVMVYPPKYPVQMAMIAAEMAPDPKIFQHSAAEYMARIGKLPLLAQPGEAWFYHTGLDVAGVLIARAAGQPLSQFMHERLFAPLGMEDTGFFVPAEKRDRLVAFYRRDPKTDKPTTDKVVPFDDPWTEFLQPPVFESGGAGLVSTVPDYMAFCRLLLAQGEHAGRQILSQASVAEMMKNQVTPAQREHAKLIRGKSSGWGLGAAVEFGNSPLGFPAGAFGWNGGYGTTAYLDPASNTTGVLLTQRMMESPQPPPTYVDFWKRVFETTSE
jgi:CubicO group peptidase (beta-lactamase class C family)